MVKKKTPSKSAKKATKKAARPSVAKSTGADDAIQQLDAQFMRTANARNAAALVKAFYTRDAVLMPPNLAAAKGHAEIQKVFQGLIDSGFTGIKLETTTIESSGDLAYGRGRYELSMEPPGGAPVQDVGKYIVVYRRQANGSWRAIADIFNSDQAGQ
jgi:ketosteroid isomerase-like protein